MAVIAQVCSSSLPSTGADLVMVLVVAACLVFTGVVLVSWRRRRVPRIATAFVILGIAAASLLVQSHPTFAADVCAAATPSTPILPIIPITPVAPILASDPPVPAVPSQASQAPVPSTGDQASEAPVPVVPEAPAVLLLGLSAAVVLGGYAALRRRRVATAG